jgi:NADH-quinone oxidoreductase subunit J
MLGAEFMAMIFLIVYVGAIAVLFLFVVMMLNVKINEYRDNYVYYLPIGGFIGLIFLFEIFLILDFQGDRVNPIDTLSSGGYAKLQLDYMTNIEVLGEILYTEYAYCFIISGMILLVSMIGAIVLTLYKKKYVKRQEISDQVYAQMDSIRLISPVQK